MAIFALVGMLSLLRWPSTRSGAMLENHRYFCACLAHAIEPSPSIPSAGTHS